MRPREPMEGPIRVLGALVLLSIAGASAAARAQPAEVEDLIRKGNELRAKEEHQWALPLFQKAYDLERSPRTAAQLGLVEAALGYWLSSERHLQEALTSTRNPWLIRFEKQIRTTLGHVQASIGEVDVAGSPKGADVFVNGQAAGQLPLAQPVRVGEGAVQVTLRAPGYKEATSHSKVGGGQRVTVSLALDKVEGAVSAPSLQLAPSRDGQMGGSQVTSKHRNDSDPPATWLRPVSWVAATGAAVALGVGLYGLHTQRTKGEAFDNFPQGSATKTCGADRADKGGTTCQSLYKQAQTGKRLMIGGLAAGGTLATAAIVGFVLSSKGSEGGVEAGAASSRPTLVSDGRSVHLGWSFGF